MPPVLNPSFEGATGVSVSGQDFTPNFYQNCCAGSFVGSCSDVCPSGSVSLAPSDGTAYAGSTCLIGVGQEGITQPVSLGTGSYQFLIDLAMHLGAPRMQIWGGSSGCQQSELLWTSPVITTANWQTHQVAFAPTQNHTQISFYCLSTTANGGYILYDHMRLGTLNHGRAPIYPDHRTTDRPTGQPRRYDLLGRQLEN